MEYKEGDIVTIKPLSGADIEKTEYNITDKKKLENIDLDIKVGDVLLGGKYRNKRIVVKDIGKNEKGDITINGRPLMKYRIIPQGD